MKNGVMKVLALSLAALSVAAGATGCGLGKKEKEKDLPPPANGYMADTGFRPNQHGFAFENGGGAFPKTPAVLDTFGMVKLFGKESCVGGNTQKCKLTPPAAEWAAMVNRAMNGGRCEGMAVASLTMFQKIDDPGKYGKGATSAHGVNQQSAMPLIGYYWAWQMVDPVRRERSMELRKTTPAQTLDKLVGMLKAKQLATIAFFAQPPMRGGHAVTPYAVEHKGNDVYWVRVYDNNWPDKERYIIIDKKANTWRYDVAALNPDTPKRPWSGNAASHSIAVVPMASRLKKADCPFCKTSSQKVVFPKATSIVITDSEGRKLGTEGDKLINEIPDAEVIDLTSYVDGTEAPEPVYILPGDDDYDLDLGSTNAKPEDDSEDDDDSTSVAIFSGGTAVSVGRNRRAAGERDTLSISRDNSGIRYKTGNGKVPRLRMAFDDNSSDGKGEGSVVGIRNIKADKDDEIDLDVDRKDGKVRLQGGGKKLDSYDLKVKRVRADADDDEVEAKGVKIKAGESHAIDARAVKKGAKPGEGVGIARGKAVVKPKKERKPSKNDRDDDKSKKKTDKDDKDSKAKDAKDAKDQKDQKDPKRPPLKKEEQPKKPVAPPQQKKAPLRK